jgi:phosphoribosylpyrophosphate synthetase
VTSLADRLNVDFALIHREKHTLVDEQTGEKLETRLTLVGDVKNKICFLLARFFYHFLL